MGMICVISVPTTKNDVWEDWLKKGRNVSETITVKVDLHEGDLELIKKGKLDVRDAVELSLNHGHNLEIISVEEGTKKT